jgi:murein DD-endopeptidase MepM/ murein hydrolase activator NlpD
MTKRAAFGCLLLGALTACSTVETSRAPASKLTKVKLTWPVAKRKISQHFKSEFQGYPHDGIDIAVPRGTRIYAPADGRVTYAGSKFKGYGKMVVLEHSSRLATIFGHCHKILVNEGEWVRKGGLIALVGSTGRASAPHLHFEVRLNREPVNPLVFLQ